MITKQNLSRPGDEMPTSVWISHDKQKKLHGFLEHLFSQVCVCFFSVFGCIKNSMDRFSHDILNIHMSMDRNDLEIPYM